MQNVCVIWVIPMVVSIWALSLPAAAQVVDPLDAAAIDKPKAVAALEKMATAGQARWLASNRRRPTGAETVDFEGGGLVTGTTTGPAGRYPPTEQEKRRGYVAFPWHYMVRMLPYSRPRRSAVGKELALVAARDEYEPAAFGVLALEDLQEVRATVGPLRSDNGLAIPPSAVTVNWVRYIPRQVKRGGEVWALGPAVLVTMKPIDIPAGCAREGWLTVKVPEDAAAGVYRGFVEVRAKGRPAARISLSLRVRPIRLDSPDPVTYAHYYNVPAHDQQLIAEMRAAKAHGSNSFSVKEILHGRFRANPAGHITSQDFSRADRFMELHKQLGFRGPVGLVDLLVQGHNDLSDSTGEYFLIKINRHKLGSEAFFRCMREVVTLIRDHARQRSWPEVLMYSSSELSRWRDVKGELIPFGIRLIKEMKSPGGVKVCASINGPDEPRFVKYTGPGELCFLPHLDVVMYNYGVPINDHTLAEAGKHPDLQLWFQNIGTRRFTEGFMLWRAGAVGRRQYKLDGRLTEEGLVASTGIFYRTADGILPTTDWENMREGVDDMRYIRTAERAIEKAKTGPDARGAAFARKAEQRLRDTRASVKIDMSRASVRRGRRPGLKSLDLYGKYRDEFARIIETLAPGRG